MVRVLLTGGAGFVGHHVAEAILLNTDWHITFLDRLDLSGNLRRIVEIQGWEIHKSRCSWEWHDLRASIKGLPWHDIFLHLGALTHVDRSIRDPLAAVYDNVVGTAHILEFARQHCGRFLYFSTDEVFGPAAPGVRYKEWDRYRSGNPYAATKAGGEELALAYHNTYAVPVIITHTMNIIGERQHPEKFLPSTIRKLQRGELVRIHSDATRSVSGSRFYIDAHDVAHAILFILENGTPGDKYNIVGAEEISNLDLAQRIAAAMGKELNYKMVDFHSARPGHDLRYALDGTKLEKLGWMPRLNIDRSIRRIVDWYQEHPNWLR